MAETIYTPNEEGMRKLAALIKENDRKHTNKTRRLAHYATRQHEAVYMPGSAVKIVIPQSTLFAAFGGGIGDYNANIDYGNADFNALAISTGNYIPLSEGSTATGRNRITYARDCTVMERDSSGILAPGTETISCFNPGSLPIAAYTMCYAQKFPGSDAWIITGTVMPHAANTRHFEFSGSAVEIDGDSTDAKFMRNSTGTARPFDSSSALADWVHDDDVDVYIHHPGTYEITYGVAVSRGSSDTSDDTDWADSDDSDTTTLPNPRTVECELIANWNPAGALAGNWDQGNTLRVVLPARVSGAITAERTFMLNHTLDNWHGQPYCRLSMAIGNCEAFDPAGTAELQAWWVSIRAAGSPVQGGNQGSGYNAFLGTDGAFQWYGGGTEPESADFGEDGT
jgi:hypothetical protein